MTVALLRHVSRASCRVPPKLSTSEVSPLLALAQKLATHRAHAAPPVHKVGRPNDHAYQER